jgi:hypothetical protein
MMPKDGKSIGESHRKNASIARESKENRVLNSTLAAVCSS